MFYKNSNLTKSLKNLMKKTWCCDAI